MRKIETTSSFGYWIRRQRKALDLTQQVLAERVGCSVAAIKKIESDERRPSRQIAERMADVLGVPADQREIFLEVARGVRSVEQLLLARESISSINTSSRPSGTVTFLYTDIEGSTKLAREHPEEWETLRARHHAILREAIESNHGYVFQVVGDGFCAAFHTAEDALRAAVKSQIDLHNENWSDQPIKVRIGIHTGKAEVQADGLYHGYITLGHVQRLMSAGHGGQVLISTATQELIRDDLTKEISLRDMGEKLLKDLIRPEHIYQLVIPDLPADFPPLKTLGVYHHNLPAQMTTFIGREKEMAEIKQAINSHRLVTLTGSGGTGKSRLALQAAADSLDTFPDGVWLVELAPLADPELIPSTVLSTVGGIEQPGKPALKTLEDFLLPKKILIILDNCEHLITSAAQTANAILNAAPYLKILASSREALGIQGELAWHVPSLTLPDPKRLPELDQLTQYEAVRLFIDRTLLVNPNFKVDNQNAPAIAQICYRLDGIPLAIELAAARVKMLSVDQISARLDDRFRLLTGGARTALPRQQTLRAMIDWSYDLLAEDERLLLRRLAVFAGGWTLELAEEICSDAKIDQVEILDMLGKLVHKSLVEVIEGVAGARYRILETVRQYAREKLFESGEGEIIRDKHLKVFLELAEQAEPETRGANQLVWLDRLEEEIDNLRAALQWSQEHDLESLLRLTGALWRFWNLRGYHADAREWFSQSIARSEGMHNIARLRVLSRASLFYAYAVTNQAKKALQLAGEASTLARELGDNFSLAQALDVEGVEKAEHPQVARQLLEEGLRICEELGDHWLASQIWYHLSETAFRQDDRNLRQSSIEKGLQEARLSKDNRRIAMGLAYLGFLYTDQGKLMQAEKVTSEAVDLLRHIGDKSYVAWCQLNLANVKLHLEEYSEAEQLITESRRQFEEIGYTSGQSEAITLLAYLAWVKNNMAQFTELVSEAEKIARTVEALEATGLAANYRGIVALLNDDFELARDRLSEALTAYQKLGIKWQYGFCLACFGMLAVAEGQFARAAQIAGAYQHLSTSLSADPPFFVRKFNEQIAIARARLGDEAFEAATNQGKEMSLEQLMAYVMEKS